MVRGPPLDIGGGGAGFLAWPFFTRETESFISSPQDRLYMYFHQALWPFIYLIFPTKIFISKKIQPP